MTLASRITGFIRDTLLAILFGAGFAMDAFVVAFRIPNLLRRLFAEGAFSQAFVPVLLNGSCIAFALWVAPHMANPIVALAWAVFFGGLAQLLFQVPFLKKIGMWPRIRWAPRDEGVMRILKLMAPAALGVSVAQVSLLINTQIASQLGDGAVSWLYFADRLMEFPSALLGVAIGTVLLPSLVRHHAAEDTHAYSRLLDWGLRVTLALALPAAVALALLSVPLISTLFWHGEFLRHDVMMTRSALIAYAVGLAGIILVKVLAPGFYARQNIRTPVKVAIVTLVVTQLLNALLVPWIRHAGLALSISVGACFNAAWLWYLMRKAGIYRPEPGWGAFLLKLAVALYLMGGALWYAMGSESSWFEISATVRAVKLALVIAAGSVTYFASLWIMGFRLRDFSRHE